MLIKLFSVLALILDFFICFFSKSFNNITDIWKPIVLFFASFIVIVIAHLLVVCVLCLFVNTKKDVIKPSKLYRWFIDKTLEFLLVVLRVKVNVNGIEKIPSDRRFLIISNHLSGFDPITLIVALMKFNLIFISKPENFKIPVVAQFIHKSGFLAIDRENARNAMKTIHKATDYVKNDVSSVCIYPEGTRSRSGELLEFKDGVFYICKKAPCPLVVMTVKNTNKVFKNFPLKPTVVNIDILGVFDPQTFAEKSTHQISDEAYVLMKSNL